MCDACEQQPCAIQLKEDVSALLAELDTLACEYDGYAFGLPLGDEVTRDEMQAVVYRFLIRYRPDIKYTSEV